MVKKIQKQNRKKKSKKNIERSPKKSGKYPKKKIENKIEKNQKNTSKKIQKKTQKTEKKNLKNQKKKIGKKMKQTSKKIEKIKKCLDLTVIIYLTPTRPNYRFTRPRFFENWSIYFYEVITISLA